jgi:hypothetical protein
MPQRLVITLLFGIDLPISSGSMIAVQPIFSSGYDTIGLRCTSLKLDTIRTLMFVKARLHMLQATIIEILAAEDEIDMDYILH